MVSSLGLMFSLLQKHVRSIFDLKLMLRAQSFGECEGDSAMRSFEDDYSAAGAERAGVTKCYSGQNPLF